METNHAITHTAPLTGLLLYNQQYHDFMQALARRFEGPRQKLLEARKLRQLSFDAGVLPDFPSETASIRAADWQVGPIPADLMDRRVEITGPVDRKMIINALNSGAKVFMADFEDASSPRVDQMLQGQQNLYDAIRRQIDFTDEKGKAYALQAKTATLIIRPRGWHLTMQPNPLSELAISASLFDFGTYCFLNARELQARGSGPYFYLPKLENRFEAALWADVFAFTEASLGLSPGTIKVTVLIETITAAFEMEEILFVLKKHITGLNAGRWDYIFSIIKKFKEHRSFILPDRKLVSMKSPFMAAYAIRLVQICHHRAAHAIGGMSAFIPSKDEATNRLAFAQVQADKEREARLGYDGTWVAHPHMVGIAQEEFDKILGTEPHQKSCQPEGDFLASDLLNVAVHGPITEAGVRLNIQVGILYLSHWLAGQGAVAIHNLMEDAATAEISRAQLWQWLRHAVVLEDGRRFTSDLYDSWVREEIAAVNQQLIVHPEAWHRLPDAIRIFQKLTIQSEFAEFLTLEASLFF